MATCSICLDDFEINDKVCRTKICNHLFHKECLKEWLKTENSCPVCRNIIKRFFKAYLINYNLNCVLKFKDDFFEFVDTENKKFYKKYHYNNLKRILMTKKNIKFSILDTKIIHYKFKLDQNHKHMILKLVKNIVEKKCPVYDI